MKKIVYSLLCLALLFVTACSSKNETTSLTAQELQVVSKIVVLPTELAATGTLSKEKAEELSAGAFYIDGLLESQLGGDPRVVFAGDSRDRAELPSITGGVWGEIKKLGEDFGADAVMVVSLGQYKERQGSSASVDTPASAQFIVRLVSTSSGQVLWVASFEETQQSLMSNIFSFGKVVDRGFKWITVEEMVAEALREKLNECPYLLSPATVMKIMNQSVASAS